MRLLARTGQPIEHGYWGRIVHDLSGVQAKASLPLDHRHDPYEVIGYGDQVEVKSGDLWVSGALVPFREDDVAAEIAYKAARGVPYEASIDFRGEGVVLEELGAGAKAEVNGYTIEGPVVIVRKWPLRAVAICEHGADPGTKTEFSDGEPETIAVQVLSRGEDLMTKDQKSPAEEPLTKRGFLAALASVFGLSGDDDQADPTTEGDGVGDGPAPKQPEGADAKQPAAPETPTPAAATPESPPAETPADAATQVRAEMKRFTAAFGEAGLPYFAEGKSFDEASAAHIKTLQEQLDAANKKLSGVDRGEDEPAEFSDGEDPEDGKKMRRLRQSLTPGTARFAASIKLPSRGNGKA